MPENAQMSQVGVQINTVSSIAIDIINFNYTRHQINQDRMIFGDFSVNSEPIFFKFYKGHFLFKS